MRLRERSITYNRLQVFKRAHTALLGSGGGPDQRTSLVPSEKCAVGWGNDGDEMRMITASFVRATERFARDLFSHFHPRFQQVVVIRKTCNQLIESASDSWRLEDVTSNGLRKRKLTPLRSTLGKQTCTIPGWTLKRARTRDFAKLFTLCFLHQFWY